MGVFYDREETAEKVIITFKNTEYFYVAMFAYLLATVLLFYTKILFWSVWPAVTVAYLAIVGFFVFERLGPDGEVKKAAKKKMKISMPGGLPIFGPVVFEILKP